MIHLRLLLQTTYFSASMRAYAFRRKDCILPALCDRHYRSASQAIDVRDSVMPISRSHCKWIIALLQVDSHQRSIDTALTLLSLR